jgi:hypothetical protein
MKDLEARRVALSIAGQLPSHMGHAMTVLRYAEALARFKAGESDTIDTPAEPLTRLDRDRGPAHHPPGED